MARIGVIVPVYKVEKMLPRCVQSILSQSFRDFILILVDDGSPDGCPQICDEYARVDSRVHVIHQKNAGSAAARNAGLDWMFANCQCQWVSFVDSDDWLHPEMLECLMTASVEHEGAVSVCGYQETGGEDPWQDLPEMKTELWDPSDFYQHRYINATVPWGKLYPCSSLEGERFTPGKYIDDEFLIYRLLLGTEKLAVVDAPLYAYYINPDGATKRAWQPRFLDAWDAFEQQLVYFEEHGYPELTKFRLRRYLENALVNLEGAKSISDEKSIQRIEKRIRNVIRRCWHGGVINFQYDFDVLVRFYPLTTKLYRFYLEKIKR